MKVNIFGVQVNLFQILIVFVLVVGLVLGIYLVTHPQIFKSRAATDILQAFEVTDEQGNQVPCINGVCRTHSLKLNIRVKDLAPLQK